jgi:hypothetical protein
MNDDKPMKADGHVNLGRHKAQCTICAHPKCAQIEDFFVDWCSPDDIQSIFGVSHDALYRHARALGLIDKRRKNSLMALEKVIERMDRTPMSGAVILSAIKTLMKINCAGQGPEPVQARDLKKLFKRMSAKERQEFAQDGSIPEWFYPPGGATPGEGQEEGQRSQITEGQKSQDTEGQKSQDTEAKDLQESSRG